MSTSANRAAFELKERIPAGISSRLWLLTVAASLASPTASLARADDSLRPWNEYRVIMWIGDTVHKQPAKFPLFIERLREMGVNAGMIHGGDADPKPFLDHQFPYYVENIVNRGLCLKWNSRVRDWEKVVTAWATTRDEASLRREYCLDDPAWRDWATERMSSIARKHGPHKPLAYDIRDELSVTISANPFDYDFSPQALAGFRSWLRGEYRDLARLNAQWETRFGSWDEVKPFTTDQVKNTRLIQESLQGKSGRGERSS